MARCSDLQTELTLLANKAIFSSDYLPIRQGLCSDYLSTNAHCLPTARKQPLRLTFSANSRFSKTWFYWTLGILP